MSGSVSHHHLGKNGQEAGECCKNGHHKKQQIIMGQPISVDEGQ
jgi:hypothetical protein